MPPPDPPPILFVSTALQKQIQEAISKIPAAHRAEPTENETTTDKDAGRGRLQDWAFTKGYALATVSNKADRLRLACVHHGEQTRDYRKLGEERKRKGKVQAKGCKFAIYVSYRKTHNTWGIGYNHKEHNHPPNPDPFAYNEHATKRPGHYDPLAVGRNLVGEVPYSQASRIMAKSGYN